MKFKKEPPLEAAANAGSASPTRPGPPKRRSSLTSILTGGRSGGPSTAALMDAGDWDAVMAKLDAKAARAEQVDAFEYAGDPRELVREEVVRRESGARTGELDGTARTSVGRDSATGLGGGGSSGRGSDGNTGNRRSSLEDALSPAAAAALASDEYDFDPDADAAAADEMPELDRDLSCKSAQSVASARSVRSASSRGSRGSGAKSSDDGIGVSGVRRASGKKDAGKGGGKRRGRRSSITKFMGLGRRRSSDNTGDVDSDDDEDAAAAVTSLTRGKSGDSTKGGGRMRGLIRRASGFAREDIDDSSAAANAKTGSGHQRGSGHRREPAQRRGSGADGSGRARRRGSGASRRASDDGANENTTGAPQSQTRSSAIRRTSSTFSRTNFIGQNFLLRTLSNHSVSVPVRVVRKMIDVDPDCVTERDFCGNSSLHVACDGGCDLEVVEHLLERNGDAAQWINNDGRSPLHVSVAPSCQSEGRVEANLEVVASIFLARPVNVVRTDRDGRTPGMLARLARSPAPVVAFLDDRAKEFEDRIHEAEGDLERRAENDEIDIPAEGLTLGFIADHVNDGYGEWTAGKAAALYGLENLAGGRVVVETGTTLAGTNSKNGGKGGGDTEWNV